MTCGWLETLKGWQDLIGAVVSLAVGLAAIVISVAALRASQRQVEVARAQFAHARDAADAAARARRRAVRASLPQVLSGICAWAASVVSALRDLPLGGDVIHDVRRNFRVEPLSRDVASALFDTIEWSDDEGVISRCRKLLGNAQIVGARLTLVSDPRMSLTKQDIDSRVFDVLVVYAQASSLFDYARGKVDAVPGPLAWERVVEGMDSFGLHGPAWGGLAEKVAALREIAFDMEEI